MFGLLSAALGLAPTLLGPQQLAAPGAAAPVRPRPGPFTEEFRFKAAPRLSSAGAAPPPAPGAPVAVAIDARRVQRMILPTLFGTNLGVWTGDNDTLGPVLEQRLREVQVPLLRFPGGNLANRYHWNGIYPPHAVSQGWDNMSQPWAVDTAEFLTLCEALDAQPLMTVNHGFHEYGSSATDGSLDAAVQLAADWVEYCNAPADGSNPGGGTDWAAVRAAEGRVEPWGVKYWEVGNEIYGAWTVGNEEADGAVYGVQYNAFHDAMKSVDPSIHLGICGHVGDAEARVWTGQVLSTPGTGERIDFIDVHDYFHWIGNSLENDLSFQQCLELVDQVGEDRQQLDQLVALHTQRAPGEVRYYMGEFNITNPTSYHTNELGNALVVTEVLGELVRNGFHGASYWLALHSWNSAGGDMAYLARNHPTVPDHTPYPNYYPFWFFTRNFGDREVLASSSSPEVAVYASRFADGPLGVILVNETGPPAAPRSPSRASRPAGCSTPGC